MSADVIIIGGGVIGTACAYFLARRGVKVLLLERNHLGSGASGATAAIVSISGTSGTPEALRRLNIESYHLILDIEQDFDQPLEVIQGGALYAAMNEQEARGIRPAYEEVCEMGIDAQWMKGSEARHFEPLLGPNVEAAFYNPASYHVNPFRLYEGYLNAALRRGSRIEYGVQVREVKLKDDAIDRIITNKGDYHADWVVLAGGVHTPEILSPLEIEIPIVPARGQVILTEACSVKTEHIISFLDHLYIKQTASGNFYLGSHTEFVGFENRITLEKIANFAQVLAYGVPLLARLRALRFFVGFRPICEDNLPIIGPLPACSKLVIASGHGRTGVRYSASTGKAVSELIVDGKTEHPIDAFRVERFTK
ncbi:MAG: FAD-binding oxidoreductase [Desulfobacterales bacterium]|nr:MAG: FAD-binding oxidoreductase [Desulfobacterales bacterium]